MPAERLRRQLADLQFPLSVAKRDDLRRSVNDYVDSLKTLEWPPERVIVAMKRIVNDAGLSSSARVTLPGVSIDERDALLVDMVGWCIKRYYGANHSS